MAGPECVAVSVLGSAEQNPRAGANEGRLPSRTALVSGHGKACRRKLYCNNYSGRKLTLYCRSLKLCSL